MKTLEKTAPVPYTLGGKEKKPGPLSCGEGHKPGTPAGALLIAPGTANSIWLIGIAAERPVDLPAAEGQEQPDDTQGLDGPAI